jgi:hypothetical protein
LPGGGGVGAGGRTEAGAEKAAAVWLIGVEKGEGEAIVSMVGRPRACGVAETRPLGIVD